MSTVTKARKKKAAPRMSAAVAKKLLGDEPIIREDTPTTERIKAYKWYRDFYSDDREASKRLAIEYLTEQSYNRAIVDKLRKVDPGFFGNLGFVFRLMANGDTKDTAFAYRRVKELAGTIEEKSDNVIPFKRTVSSTVSNRIIADFDDVIDFFVLGEFDEFDIADYLRSNNISAAAASSVAEHYRPLYQEVAEAVTGKNDELKEAYGHWDRGRLKLYLNLMKTIVGSASDRGEALVAVRKPRKPRAKKVKLPAQIVAKVQYMKEDPTFKIKSVPPEGIIGASQVWLFNTRYRLLTVLNAETEAGLSVKGTTIIDFDEKTSAAKRLRKPELVLTTVLNSGKVALRKIMDSIKTLQLDATGRIGKDTVILKIVK